MTKMKIKGICRDCSYRWQYGIKGNKQHLCCSKDSRIVKNPNMKSCPNYKKADIQTLKIHKRSRLGGIGKIN